MILCLQGADLSMTFWLFGCLKENVIGQYILIQVTDNSKEPTASFLIHLTYQPSWFKIPQNMRPALYAT